SGTSSLAPVYTAQGTRAPHSPPAPVASMVEPTPLWSSPPCSMTTAVPPRMVPPSWLLMTEGAFASTAISTSPPIAPWLSSAAPFSRTMGRVMVSLPATARSVSTTIGDVSTGGGGGGGGGGGVSLTFEPPPPQAESASARHAARYFDIAFPMHFGRQRSVLGARAGDFALIPMGANA